MPKDIYTIFSELATLKQDLFKSYFEDQEIKEFFLGEEIAYDFFFYPAIFRKYQIKPRGALYFGGHKGELLLQFILVGFTDIIIVEPVPELFEQLQVKIEQIHRLLNCYGDLINDKPISSIEAVQCAVSNENGSAEFHVTSNSYIGSLFKPNAKVFEEQEIFTDATVNKRIIVPTRTVDSIIKQSSKNFSDFNFLYLNTQGAELQALESAEKTLAHIDCIYLEKDIAPRYENLNSVEEIDRFILERNFVKEWEYLDERWGVAFSFYVKTKT
ncbi:MAG: FkbM family methyltransferase [Moorea sp. SIO3I7]|uniref:FkbM family methyltransferase n=1 Tax=unclassified Moorena TaxID=2683338 RepID=UPI0013C1EE42|nr:MULTISPECIES: FkbM family methyltransferase [unclassified Moorena]NEN95813.1 FkbM family methyltransferase [Moorena sp. SIO3I7]NEO09521.1 FkbM family methyltransferase [Moorena sp. SIO3I8]NEO23691.1 FkbM family methyltransferase [Moorena sp. SIO4A5]NEQ59716.1 FkbM family methyltransferase [Moorena sp. SIO4A1]